MNFKKEFNKRVRENIWNKHNQRFIMFFNYALARLKQIDNYYIPKNLLPPCFLQTKFLFKNYFFFKFRYFKSLFESNKPVWGTCPTP